MKETKDVVMVIISAPVSEGGKIAWHMVEKRLAACGQVVSGIKSFFWWEGEVQKDEEVLIFLKTEKRLVDEIIAELSHIHPYEVPELIVLPVTGGLPEYIDWVKGIVRK